MMIHENLNAKKKRQVLMHEAHSPCLPFGCCNAPEFLSPATGILSILLSLASGNRGRAKENIEFTHPEKSHGPFCCYSEFHASTNHQTEIRTHSIKRVNVHPAHKKAKKNNKKSDMCTCTDLFLRSLWMQQPQQVITKSPTRAITTAVMMITVFPDTVHKQRHREEQCWQGRKKRGRGERKRERERARDHGR